MRNILFIVLLLIGFSTAAQTAYKGGYGLIYDRHQSYGMHIHNLGWGLETRWGWYQGVRKSTFFDLNISHLKNPKEYKMSSGYQGSRSYVYGKLNDFWTLRAGVGVHRQMFEPNDWNGIDVGYQLSCGMSLGLLKPQYLIILKFGPTPDDVVEVEEKYNPSQHFIENIKGNGSFFSGLNELKPYTGAYLKAGMTFDVSQYEDEIRIFEVGATADLFPVKIPILYGEQNRRFYLAFYFAFRFGKKT